MATRTLVMSLIFTLVSVLVVSCDSDPKDNDNGGNDAGGTPAGNDAGAPVDEYAVWCDSDTSLCWQNPQREAYNESDIGLRYQEAILYCEELVLGGYDDWRLPTAAELRSIIAGYPGTETGGSCMLGGEKEDVTFEEGWGGGDCGYALSLVGPGDGGCYTKEGIKGTCSKTDIYSYGHEMEFFAVDTPSDDDPVNPQVATIMFDNAAVVWNHRCTLGEARCVRSDDGSSPTVSGESASCQAGTQTSCPCSGDHQSDGYKVCAEDGQSFGPCDCVTYTPVDADQPDCHNMVCEGADRIKLNIDVDGWDGSLGDPTQLIALWYKAEGWSFPQARPPEGGTWTNQVVDPGPPPYTMEVPGCTYYQERLLEGDYYMMVILQIDDKFPPIPIEKDYWWGYEQEATHFPFEASGHAATAKDLDITLTSVSQCPNLCTTPPSDDNVITCRYASNITTDNCADFLADEWTEEEVTAACKDFQGMEPDTLVVTTGGSNSCLYTKGACGMFNRCQGVYEDGRKMYAYGVPDNICASFVPSAEDTTEGIFEEDKPFCCAYDDDTCTNGSF